MFEAFPKIARLQRDCVITEKLDGTNAQVTIVRHEDCMSNPAAPVAAVGEFEVYAGSRTRLIYPGKTTDNFSFAAWVQENAEELTGLGEGRHFGEWFGNGIQRNYGLQEKRFALFNTERWRDNENSVQNWSEKALPCPSCCTVVPVLYAGAFDNEMADITLGKLRAHGSYAVPGFMNPEGIIIFHTAARVLFKQTFDDAHKEAA